MFMENDAADPIGIASYLAGALTYRAINAAAR